MPPYETEAISDGLEEMIEAALNDGATIDDEAGTTRALASLVLVADE